MSTYILCDLKLPLTILAFCVWIDAEFTVELNGQRDRVHRQSDGLKIAYIARPSHFNKQSVLY